MNVDGKTVTVTVEGKRITIYNQRSPLWDHPYPWEGKGNLHDSGCGIFAIAHLCQYLWDKRADPRALADFSVRYGGRGDDGTDRPKLLAAMKEKGLAREYGFSYHMDGLLNDPGALFRHVSRGGGALCNLRPGHIVCLIGAREKGGEKQVLSIDSYSESADPRVIGAVRECLKGSEMIFPLVNDAGALCGFQKSYSVYWAALSAVRDYNLLHPLSNTP